MPDVQIHQLSKKKPSPPKIIDVKMSSDDFESDSEEDDKSSSKSDEDKARRSIYVKRKSSVVEYQSDKDIEMD
jgi:hypothetical protein